MMEHKRYIGLGWLRGCRLVSEQDNFYPRPPASQSNFLTVSLKKTKKTPEGDPHRSGSAKSVPDRDPFSIGIFHTRTGRNVRKAMVNSPIGL